MIPQYSQQASQKWFAKHDEWWTFFDEWGEPMIQVNNPRGPILRVWPDEAGANQWRNDAITSSGTTFMRSWQPRTLNRKSLVRLFNSEGCRILALGHLDARGGAILEDFGGKGIQED
jgi:hypothetical protein